MQDIVRICSVVENKQKVVLSNSKMAVVGHDCLAPSLLVTGNQKGILCSATQNYKVLKVIGGGSFGEVARCQIKNTKKNVAVKIFKDPVHLELVRNEV